MIYKEIQDVKVPALGFGTYLLTGDDCVNSVEHALGLGYRHIDTARAYENETEVGKGIKNSTINRDKIFLTSKIWMNELQPEDVISSTNDSLKKLGTDYLDLLLIHWPNPQVDLGDTLDAMFDLVNSGAVRHVGVSNFTPDQLESGIEKGPVFCNQVEYHPFLDQSELLSICQRSGILFTAYSPIARGKVNENEEIKAIASDHQKTPSQITLRWLIQQDNVSAIPKASSRIHREENFNIFDFELSEDQMKRISSQRKNIRLVDPSWSPEW